MASLLLALVLLPVLAQAGLPRMDRHGDPLPDGAIGRLGSVRLRTSASVVALGPDGRTLLTATGGRTVGRWDTSTGRLQGEIHLPGPAAELAWFAPDGRTLAVPEGGKLGLWDTGTGKRRLLLPAPGDHAAFSPDGRLLATADYVKGTGRIHLWHLAAGQGKVLAMLPSYANDLVFGPDGKRLYAAVDNHSLRCWDTATGRPLWQNDQASSHVVVAPDGRVLCSDTYFGGPIHLWDAATGKRLGPGPLGTGRRWPVSLAFSPDGQLIAQGTVQGAFVWDVATSKQVRHLPTAGPHVVFAADGRSLFSVGALLQRWDVRTGRPFFAGAERLGHVGPVQSLAFAPDGRALATCGADGTLRRWDLADGRYRMLRDRRAGKGDGQSLFPAPPLPPAFTPDGRLLLAAAPGAVVLVEAATGKEVRRFRLPDPPPHGWSVVAAVRLTDDGQSVLALGRTDREPSNSIDLNPLEPLRGWDVQTGRETLSRTVPSALPAGAAFSPDGRLCALPWTRKLLDLGARREYPLQGGPIYLGPPLVFSPDSHLLAAVEQENVGSPVRILRVYEALTGRPLARIETALGPNPLLAFGADSRLLVAAGSDALHAWEATTGRRLLHLPALGRLTNWSPSRFASCLAASPDGKTLATGHDDGTVVLWDLGPARRQLDVPTGPVDAAACWQALAGDDAVAAYAAIDRLAGAPAQALPLLRRHLAPEEIDPAWLAARLADLDSPSFRVRHAATRELERVVEAVESALKRARRHAVSAEVERRLGRILERPWPAPSSDLVRQWRAVVVLERIGSPAARALLRELSRGRPDARLTRAAQGESRRLGLRPAGP